MPDDGARLKTIFNEALENPEPAARAVYLDHACGDNADLRRRVYALLAAYHAAGRFLEPESPSVCQTIVSDLAPPPPTDAAKTVYPSVSVESRVQPNSDHVVWTDVYHHKAEAGTVIAGRYTRQEKIGEGGMGEVWVAKQTEPIKRKVALKLIKSGIDSRAVIARFEQERQALAMMDHPNIAKVLDAGLTPPASHSL